MYNLNRRQFMGTSAATALAAILPTVAVSESAIAQVAFVKPTTNILHMSARYARTYGFSRTEVMRIFGAEDLANIPQFTREELQDRYYEWRRNHKNIFEMRTPWIFPDEISEWIEASIIAARDRADAGDDFIYQRAEHLNRIRRHLNEYFCFDPESVRKWLNASNQFLGGIKFRDLMVSDIELAAENLEFALTGEVAQES